MNFFTERCRARHCRRPIPKPSPARMASARQFWALVELPHTPESLAQFDTERALEMARAHDRMKNSEQPMLQGIG